MFITDAFGIVLAEDLHSNLKYHGHDKVDFSQWA